MPRKSKVDTTSKRSEERQHAEAVHQVNDKIDKLQETPPRYLSNIASRAWSKTVPALNKSGLATTLDKQTLEAWCISYEILRKSYEDIKTNGATYTTDSGRTYKNPNVDILSDNLQKMKTLGAELGLSPQSRTNLVDTMTDDGSEDFKDIMAQFGGK